MKQRHILLLVLVAVLGFSSCAEKSKKAPIVSSRTNRDANSNDTTGQFTNPPNGTTWGDVTSSDQYSFEAAAKSLMGATLAAEYIGTISGYENDTTGVRFWGQVELSSGTLNSVSNTKVNISTSKSRLRLVIWDSYAGMTDSQGKKIPEYPIYFSQATSGYVDGNRAVIEFKDSYGTIILDGYFDSYQFSGNLSFKNTKQYDGSAGASGTLGTFRVSTCGFFRC